MKITLSTIKSGKVYGVLPVLPMTAPVSREVFIRSVIQWAHGYFQTVLSVFEAVEKDLYSVVIVLEINNDQEAPQQEIDIPVI